MNFQVLNERTAEPVLAPAPPLPSFDKTPQSRTRLLDKVFALSMLLLFSPVLIVLAVLISLGGQNPIFRQKRVGYQAKLFEIYKFRTFPKNGWKAAARDAETSAVARLRLALFRRVSLVLRATGLDELPQFANILKGDMQVIGPRPLVVDDFRELPDGRSERCVVPPGITGLAQINGGQDLGPAPKLALDLYVIDNFSFAMVAKIVARTILRILGFTGATAKACANDLALAEENMARRKAAAATALRPVAAHSDAAQSRSLYQWLVKPSRQLRPIRLSPRAALTKVAADAKPDLHDVPYTGLENR